MSDKNVQNTNAVALTTVNTALGRDLFSDIDFGALDNAIDEIGKVSAKLSVDEKEMAMGIIDSWNENVVERLHNRQIELHHLAHFMQIPTDEHDIFDATQYKELEQALARDTSTTTLYTELVEARENYNAHLKAKPLSPVVEDDTLINSGIDEKAEYTATKEKYVNKTRSLLRKVLLSEQAWKKALLDNEQISNIHKSVLKQIRNINNMVLTTAEKSSVAKINVAIEDNTVRTNLKALFDFSKQI